MERFLDSIIIIIHCKIPLPYAELKHIENWNDNNDDRKKIFNILLMRFFFSIRYWFFFIDFCLFCGFPVHQPYSHAHHNLFAGKIRSENILMENLWNCSNESNLSDCYGLQNLIKNNKLSLLYRTSYEQRAHPFCTYLIWMQKAKEEGKSKNWMKNIFCVWSVEIRIRNSQGHKVWYITSNDVMRLSLTHWHLFGIVFVVAVALCTKITIQLIVFYIQLRIYIIPPFI